MPGCVVRWCRSDTRSKSPGITFHSFPADPIRKIKWMVAVRLERRDYDWMPMKTSRVCSIHFHEKDLYKSLKGYTMIHKTAVPVCTMIRPEKTSKSSSDAIENAKINNNERLPLVCNDNENTLLLVNKTNTADYQAHKAQKRELENNINSECNDYILEEPRKKINKMNLDSTDVSTFEESGLCVTPINVPSSDIESTLNTLKTHMLKQKLRKKSILAKKRLSQIRNLRRRNKRLTMKNLSLKNILSQYKKKMVLAILR